MRLLLDEPPLLPPPLCLEPPPLWDEWLLWLPPECDPPPDECGIFTIPFLSLPADLIRTIRGQIYYIV